MNEYKEREFVLLECSSTSHIVRRACIGATFTGNIRKVEDRGWYYHRIRNQMRRRGINPDEFFSNRDIFYGTISMIQKRKGSRAKLSKWNHLSLGYMVIDLIPMEEFDTDV